MDRYLLKNIIIIILVLVNGCLLGSLFTRQTATQASRRQAEEHLAALFAADGMTLEEDAISHKTPPAALSLSREGTRQQAAAAFFLGQNLLRDDQGGMVSYISDTGVARFRTNGSFEIEGRLASSEVETLCQSFCREFSYDAPVFLLDEDGSGTGTAVCRYNNLPVFNCTLTFTLERGTLIRVAGTLLPEESTALSNTQEPLSAMAALTAFQQMYRESSQVVSVVSDTELCYELQTSSTSTLTLTPVWRVVTDTLNYYVNCSTGVVASG